MLSHAAMRKGNLVIVNKQSSYKGCRGVVEKVAQKKVKVLVDVKIEGVPPQLAWFFKEEVTKSAEPFDPPAELVHHHRNGELVFIVWGKYKGRTAIFREHLPEMIRVEIDGKTPVLERTVAVGLDGRVVDQQNRETTPVIAYPLADVASLGDVETAMAAVVLEEIE